MSIYGEATLFDVPLNEASIAGGMGASATVYPSVTDDFWFNLSLQFDAFSLTSATTLSLVPFGFSQQRFDIGFGFDGFSIYTWGALSHTFEPSAGVGLCYSFP